MIIPNKSSINNRNLKIVALIPLRAGSKGIKNKNIKLVNSKPLFSYVLDAAHKSKLIDGIFVSTESKKIKDMVKNYNSNTEVIDRPRHLSLDKSSTESVMFHFASKIQFDILVTIQATSPLTSEKDLDSSLIKFIKNDYDSMLSCIKFFKFLWSRNGTPLNYDFKKRPRRQDFQGSYLENGAFYITKRKILINNKSRLGGKIGFHIMKADKSIDIDTIEDMQKTEYVLKNVNKKS